FLYFDGQSWRSTWDTRKENLSVKLPRKVKTILKIQSSGLVEGQRLTREFTRIIKLEQGKDEQEQSTTLKTKFWG
ncbi:MAG: hypothetical protein NC911_03570, partial [Candidatus Omnitrophica bacterium]|nr:hypothetical protein [Candidatus Omnitrophota bacterium]